MDVAADAAVAVGHRLMNLRPKTKTRLSILLMASISLLAAGSTVVVVQLGRYERRLLVHRAAGMNAFQHGDYRTAAVELSRYLGNDRVDAEAIYDYAVARTHLPRPDMGHLLDAQKLFDRFLELQPGDLNAQHQLLDIYQKLHYPAETMIVADTLLDKNPDDVMALNAKLKQLSRDLKYNDALPISLRLNELTPLDVQVQAQTLELMTDLRRPAASIIDRADQLLAAHPGDPRFQLLRGVAAFFTQDLDGTRQWLRTAAAGTPPDADFILLLAGVFDKMNMWDDSRAVLQKAAASPTASVQIKALLAQRLWELNQVDAALNLLSGVSPTEPGADSRLLGMLGLVLINRDHPTPGQPSAAVDAVIKTLGERTDDLVAIAWNSLLQVAANPWMDPVQGTALCQTAERLDRDNADARFFLAQEYRQLGESELALQCLREQLQMQPEWAAPYVLMARILLDRGQSNAAAIAAEYACQRDPNLLAAQRVRAICDYHTLVPNASPAQIRPLLTYIKQVRSVAPDDPQLLAAQIDLLARSDQQGEAVDVAVAWLASPTASSLAALGQLEAVDRSDNLELTRLITDRAAGYRAATAEEALQQVLVFAAAGQTDRGAQLLAPMEKHPEVEWKLASLQAREALGDTTTGPAWETLADSQPRDRIVQQAALHSPAVNANRGLTDRTIDRIKALTGDDALEWRLARARWQLSATDDVKDNANAAAASMAEVVRLAPQYAAPQALWADALVRLGDLNGAIAHLKLAAELEPGEPGITLQLAKLQLEQGQFQAAVSQLDGLVSNVVISNAQRVEAAALYRSAGQPASGIVLLRDSQPIHPDEPQRDLLLAQLLVERGDATAAGEIYESLMQQPHTTAEVIRAAAWFAASKGQLDVARQRLARLDELPLPAGEKQTLLAQFELAYGTPAAAEVQFQSAVKAAPNSPRPWLAWAGAKLRARDFSAALTLAQQGEKNATTDASLKAMEQRLQTLGQLSLSDDLQPLLDDLSVDPANEAGAAALSAIATSQSAHESVDALAERLTALSARFATYLPLLNLTVHTDCAAGRFDNAAVLARSACEALPVDAEPARLLSFACSAAGHWDAALTAATDWRSRSLADPQPADLAIARAQIELQHGDRALDQLLPYLTKASSSPDAMSDKPTPASTTLELYLKALCLQDRADQAWGMVSPMVRQSHAWRRRWLQIVGQTAKDPASGADQLHLVEPMLEATSVDDQLARGEAWCTIGSRFNDTASLQTALSVVEPLTDTSAAPADAWLLMGGIQQELNNLPDAESAFAKAVQLSPDWAVAKNNLAMIMWLRGEDAHAAQQLAMSAVTAAPGSSAMHCTLGEIDQQLNDPDGARSQFEIAVQLSNENTEALIGLASVQDRTGHGTEVPGLVQQADALLAKSHHPLPPQVQQELQRLHNGTRSSASTMQTP
jgi:tetratricopeptide (TPR) repeat protein